MALAPFEKTNPKIPDVKDLHSSVVAFAEQFKDKHIVDGRLIPDIQIAMSVEKVVAHGLGRQPLGWIVVKKNAGAEIWDSQSTNTTPARTLLLNSSANVTISLWVF